MLDGTVVECVNGIAFITSDFAATSDFALVGYSNTEILLEGFVIDEGFNDVIVEGFCRTTTAIAFNTSCGAGSDLPVGSILLVGSALLVGSTASVASYGGGEYASSSIGGYSNTETPLISSLYSYTRSIQLSKFSILYYMLNSGPYPCYLTKYLVISLLVTVYLIRLLSNLSTIYDFYLAVSPSIKTKLG